MISSISELIARSAKTFKHKAFIRYLDSNKYISFNQLEELKIKFNTYLNSLKVFNKDRVVVLMDNSPMLVILFLFPFVLCAFFLKCSQSQARFEFEIVIIYYIR